MSACICVRASRSLESTALVSQTDLMKRRMYDTPICMPLLACYEDAHSLFSVFINADWPPLTYITLRLRVN